MARFFACLSLVCSLFCTLSFAQQYPFSGFPPFSTQTGSQNDLINLADSNISLNLPIRAIKAGPAPLSFSAFGASNVYTYFNPDTGKYDWGFTSPAFSLLQNVGASFSYYFEPDATTCPLNSQTPDNLFTNFVVTDANGTVHPLAASLITDSLGCYPSGGVQQTTDGSGYTFVFTGYGAQGTLYDKFGNTYTGNAQTGGNTTMKTPDEVTALTSTTASCSGDSCTTVTDSLSSVPVLTHQYASPVGSGPATYTYNDAQGHSQSYTVNYSAYTVASNFVCSGVVDYAGGPVNLPTSVTTPSGTYSFTYETTPNYSSTQYPPPYTTGRIASMTLSTGGSISYTYAGGNNGINCKSWVVPTLTRTVNDNNGNVSKWTYVNSNINGGYYNNLSVAVTDPAGNQTAYNFQGQLQTQAASYQGGCPTTITGCSGGGTLLKTVTTCYNAVFSNCAVPTITIDGPPARNLSQTDVFTSYNGGKYSLVETKFDTYGDPIEVQQYDYVFATVADPSGTTPLSDTLTSYGQSWNGSACSAYPSGVYIYTTPCYSKTISAGATVAQTQITYSNTGHPTQTSKWVSGSAYLQSSATYASNGVVTSVTDVNNATTQYSNGPGVGACGGLLSVGTTYPQIGGVQLSTSQTWDCNGGVMTSFTDANTQPTTTKYVLNGAADPLYRPLAAVDPLNNPTNFTYSVTTAEGALNFNGAVSSSDNLTTVDGLGRQIFAQTRQGQAPATTTFDSIQTTYGWGSANGTCTMQPPYTVGACTTRSVPYSGTAGQLAPGGTAVTTTQNDALGRPRTVTDGGGGTTTYSYPQNDVLVTLSPPPAGENSKNRQSQYDGMGRLTSVCEILSTGGSGCGQTSPASGYKTSYAYSVPTGGGSQIAVTQGVQTRSYVYDELSRLTSETNPESATATGYTYDSVAAHYCGNSAQYSSPGNLVAKADANGNHLCYYYDSLNRLTEVNANGTTCRLFYYDGGTGFGSSIPSGVSTPTNVKGRMFEAVTTNCGSTLITDEWFSYDADGHATDMWESTPQSGRYYHSKATFYGSGLLNTVQLASPSLYTVTYTPDGEGRWNTFKLASNTVVSGTTYNAASQPTYIYLGSGSDQDHYQYDGNTGRMTNWTFSVGSKNQTGTLAWNPSGTLKQMAITDGFNSGGTQTCSFNPSLVSGTGYDDLNRLIGVSCGTGGAIWNQAFSYDQYGNLTKASSGPGISWNPGYSSSTNHYTLGGTSYDANGNVTNDSFNAYIWNEFSKMASVNQSGTGCATSGECIIYDAFGRIAEIDSGSTSEEIWYTQAGKTGFMNGSSSLYAYWPTPGGGTDDYNGNNQYMHKDWLNSPRIMSNVATATETMDRAYAPYGESYDNFGSTGISTYTFTGDNEDIIKGMYDTPNRELAASNQGRWLSPDPAGLGAVDFSNPQSWNRYAYVTNNPMNSIDPTGLGGCPVQQNPAICQGGYLFNNAYFLNFTNNWDPFASVWGFYTSGVPEHYGWYLIGPPLPISYLTSWITGRTPPNGQYKLVRTSDCFAPGDAVRSSTYSLQGPDASNAVITEHQLNQTMTHDNSGQSSQAGGIFEDEIGPDGTYGEKGSIRYFTGSVNGENLGVIPVTYTDGSSYAYEGIWFFGDPQTPSNTQVFVNGSQADTMKTEGSCNH